MLVWPIRRWRDVNSNEAHESHESRSKKADPDCAPRTRVSIDFGEDIPKDVSDWEKQLCARDPERSNRADLRPDEVGDQQHYDEDVYQYVVIPKVA